MTRPTFISSRQERSFFSGFTRIKNRLSVLDWEMGELISRILGFFERRVDNPHEACSAYISGLFNIHASTANKYMNMGEEYRYFTSTYYDPRDVWVSFGGWDTIKIFGGLSDGDRDRLENILIEETHSLGRALTSNAVRRIMAENGIRSQRPQGRWSPALAALVQGEMTRLVGRLQGAGLKERSARTAADDRLLAANAATLVNRAFRTAENRRG